MDPEKRRQAMQMAKELFLEDPGLSLDKAEKELNRQHRGIPHGDLSRIRQEVRQAIGSGGAKVAIHPSTQARIQPLIRRHGQSVQPVPPTPVTVKPEHVPFNPPRLSPPANTQKPTTTVRQDIDQKPTTPEAAPPLKEGTMLRTPTKQERTQWLEDWLLENVKTASVSKARNAMLEKFGAGYAFGSLPISQLLKSVREAAGMAPRTRRGRPSGEGLVVRTAGATNTLPFRRHDGGMLSVEEAVQSIVSLMQSSGLVRVEFDGDSVKVLRSAPQEMAFKMGPG